MYSITVQVSSTDYSFGLIEIPTTNYATHKSESHTVSFNSCTIYSIVMVNCKLLLDLYHPNVNIASSTFHTIGGVYGDLNGPTNLLYLNLETDSLFTITSSTFRDNYLPSGSVIALQ